MSEVEETLKRIQAHKGVTGVIVVNQEGTMYTMYSVLEYTVYTSNVAYALHNNSVSYTLRILHLTLHITLFNMLHVVHCI